jgi:trigger factor
MQVTETLNQGLKRKLAVVIPASVLNEQLDRKLDDLKGKAVLKGFRPGKIPVAHLKKIYGKSAMSEVLSDAINSTVSKTLEERSERAAAQPKVDLPEDQSAINSVLEGKSDLSFDVSYEVLPPVQLMDLKGIRIDEPVVDIVDEDVEKEMQRVFRQQRGYEDKGEEGTVAEGDRLGLRFNGMIEGQPFEGSSADHAHLTVGSGEFIPGFEQQLVGMKKGGTKTVTVTFPADYAKEDLRGKTADFEVTVLHIDAPIAGVEFNDDFASKLGLENIEALREAVRDQMRSALDSMSRQAMKRQILDALDEGHKFDVPEQLVDAEFNTIWERVKHEIEQHGRSFEDEGTTEDEARDQYRRIAERRVRLGLVVAEIGNHNKIEVTEQEHQQALIAEVRRFPGQEQQVYDYYRKNPSALASLRAPVFENKVVDFIAELADKTEKKTTRDELSKIIAADDELPEEHHHHDHDDHDHDHHEHDHDHDHDHEHDHDR